MTHPNNSFPHFEPCCHVIYGSPGYHPHAAHSLLHDLVRDSKQVVRGPPGPPGPPGTPGHVRWVSSGDNVVDVVEYIRCRLILIFTLYVVVLLAWPQSLASDTISLHSSVHLPYHKFSLIFSPRPVAGHCEGVQQPSLPRTSRPTWSSRSPWIRPMVWLPRKRHKSVGIHQM